MTATTQPIQIVLPLLTLTLTGGDATEQALARKYWDHTVDASGRPVWVHPANELAERYGTKVGQLRARVAIGCTAHSPTHSCESCHTLLPVLGRADFTRDYPAGLCEVCRAQREAESAARAEQERRREEAERQAQTAYLADRYPLSPDSPLAPDLFTGLPMGTRCLLAVLLPTADPLGLIHPNVRLGLSQPLDADPDWLRNTLVDVEKSRALLVHPASDPSAFDWETIEQTGVLTTPRWRPTQATWYTPGLGRLAARAEHAATLADEALRAPWTPGEAEQVLTEARRIVVAEAARFFHHAINLHHLAEVTEEQQDRLIQALTTAAEHYSLGQCYAMAWSVSKDGGAAKQRQPGMPRQSATTAALNRLTGYVQQAITKGWDLQHFDVRRDVPLAATTTRLFGLLGLDPMRATPAEITAAVAARRRPTNLDEQAEHLIATGVNEQQAQAATRSLDELAAALHPLRAAADPGTATSVAGMLLTGFREMIEDARSTGIPLAEAFRAAYLGLGYARHLHRDGAGITARCRAYVRAALTGTLDVKQVMRAMADPAWPASADRIES